MARLLVTLIVPVLALIPSMGCSGQSCTAIGCGSAVDFYFPELQLDEGRRGNIVDADGCVGDICQTVRWRFEGDDTIRVTGTGIDVNPFGGGLGAALILPHDADLNIRDTYEAWMELSVNGGEPVRLDAEVGLEQIQPNGPGCGPVCLRAEVR